MKVLLSYASEFDKGEGIHFERILRRLGHEVIPINVSAAVQSSIEPKRIVLGFSPGTTLEHILYQIGHVDLFLYIEPLGAIPLGLETSTIPTACVISDVHRNLKARQTLSLLFDHVFLYQRNYLDRFQTHPLGAVHWSPWACDTELFKDLGQQRDIDVAFIGQPFGPRKHILNTLRKKYRVNEQRYYLQREIPLVYARAKIIINLPVDHDLNCRVFEAMSAGALLLTTRERNGQEELFREAVHYDAFDDQAELFQKIDYYLAHEDERAAIAAAGHAEVIQKHNLAERLKRIILDATGQPHQAAPIRAMSQREVLQVYAYVYERSGWVEALLRLAAESRGRPWRRGHLMAMGAKSFLRRAVLGW